MKRSEINNAILKAKERLAEWTPEDWNNNKGITQRIRERMLGWDVTDFGSDDFKKCGAVLFTVRNGDKNDAENKAPYAEKYIILSDETQQEIPLHYHIEKTEDIINRGGGVLVVELYNKGTDGKLDTQTPVEVYLDGVKHTINPGEPVKVTPGNSITLEPFVYHKFYAESGKGLLIVGEVSKVNDDNNDNVFLVTSNRFGPVEEDELPIHPLVNEY